MKFKMQYVKCSVQNVVCKPKTFLGAAPHALTVDSLGLLCAESGKLTGRVDRDFVAGNPDMPITL